MLGAMARWRRGLTHMPFTHAFMGSNPVRVTNGNKITPFIELEEVTIDGFFIMNVIF